MPGSGHSHFLAISANCETPKEKSWGGELLEVLVTIKNMVVGLNTAPAVPPASAGPSSPTYDLAEVYEKFCPALLRMISKLGVPASELEDTAHDAFFVFSQTYDPNKGEPFSFLCGVARNLERNRRRSASKQLADDTHEGESLPVQEGAILTNEVLVLVEKLLENDEWEFALHRWFGDRTLSEIAKHMGRSESSVKRLSQKVQEKILNLRERHV